MTTFEKLDFIADSVNPALVALTIIFIVYNYIRQGVKTRKKNLIYFLLAIVCVYVLRFLDSKFKWGLSFGLDYSTHTALSLVCTMCLVKLSRKLQLLWWTAWLMYLLLMLYQGYHTIMDIVSTSVVLITVLFFLDKIFNRLFFHKKAV